MSEEAAHQPAGRRPSVFSSIEGRAALAGIFVAMVLLSVFAVRLHPSGASPTSRAAPVSSPTRSTFWVVGAGQTLGLISARTGLPVSRIEALNPGTGAGGLIIGQRLRLRASHAPAG